MAERVLDVDTYIFNVHFYFTAEKTRCYQFYYNKKLHFLRFVSNRNYWNHLKFIKKKNINSTQLNIFRKLALTLNYNYLLSHQNPNISIIIKKGITSLSN